MKIENIADLEKMSKGLASHFTKAASQHKDIASAHEKMAAAQTEHAAFAKGKADAMDDGDVMKAYMTKAADVHTASATHHSSLAKAHQALAEQHTELAANVLEGKAATAKAAGDPAPTGNPTPTPAGDLAAGTGIAAMLEKTTDGLVAKALETLNTDPKVSEQIQQIVLARVNEALGSKLQPTKISSVIPAPRTGQPSTAKDVPAEFQELVSVEE